MPKAKLSLKEYEELVYGTADKIYYLYRKNTLEHLKSMITADFTDMYSPYKEFKEVHVDVTQQQIEDQLKRIDIDVQRLNDLQGRYNGETIYFEDFATDQLKYRYESKFFCNGKELPHNLGLFV